MAYTILVVDDDETQLTLTQQVIRERLGYHTVAARGGREAIERFLLRAQPHPNLVLVDLMMPEVGGMEVVRAIRRSDKQIPIIVFSAYGGMKQAMEAIEAGANDFLLKPVSVERLRLSIQNLLQRVVLNHEVNRLARHQRGQVSFADLVGQDPAFLAAISLGRRVVDSAIPVLIQGERGVGKELLARAIHGSGKYAAEPCEVFHAALDTPEQLAQLLQSSSHDKSAHLPARAVGRGTLLIKQAENLSPACQQLLLEQLGAPSQGGFSGAAPPFAGRIIATCDTPLQVAMQRGDLIDTLYFRLSAFPIAVPSLRERCGDVMLLADHYAARYAVMEDRPTPHLSEESKRLLAGHHWAGNVSELMQMMQRAVIQCEGRQLKPYHFLSLLEQTGADWAEYLEAADSGAVVRRGMLNLVTQDGNIKPMQTLEAEMIQYAIRHYRGKMSEVARRLGIGRSTLYRKMQDYQIDHQQVA